MKKGLILLMLSSMLVLTCSGCGLIAPASRSSEPVVAAVDTPGSSEQNILSGKTEAVRSSDVVSRISGKIRQVLVDTGAQVKKGQVLVQLEADDLEASREVCQANLENALVTEKYAASNYERGKALSESNVISAFDYANQYEKPLEKARVEVRLAQANLHKAEIACADASITAPFDGVVASCAASPGEMATTQAVLLTLIDIDQLIIRANADENQINLLQVGQAHTVEIPALPGKALQAVITSIAPAPNAVSRAYEVELALENPGHMVKAGMFVRVALPVAGAQPAGEGGQSS